MSRKKAHVEEYVDQSTKHFESSMFSGEDDISDREDNNSNSSQSSSPELTPNPVTNLNPRSPVAHNISLVFYTLGLLANLGLLGFCVFAPDHDFFTNDSADDFLEPAHVKYAMLIAVSTGIFAIVSYLRLFEEYYVGRYTYNFTKYGIPELLSGALLVSIGVVLAIALANEDGFFQDPDNRIAFFGISVVTAALLGLGTYSLYSSPAVRGTVSYSYNYSQDSFDKRAGLQPHNR